MKRNFWDVLAWIAFGIVFMYFFLKIIGVLNSPVSVDVVALISGSYFVGRYTRRIDDGFKDVENMKNDLINVKLDLGKLNNKCPILK